MNTRRLAVPVLTVAVVSSLATAVVVSRHDAGGGGGSDLAPAGAFQADLQPASSCDDLLASYRERALDLVTPYGWDLPYYALERSSGVLDDGLAAPLSADSARAPGSEAGTTRSTASDTGTTVQEDGVDEPDVVKTDGDLLVRVQGGELVVYDVTGRQTRRLSSVGLYVDDPELLLAGDRVLALGATPGSDGTATRVQTVSLADPAEPEVVDEVDDDGALLSARQHGTGSDAVVRLVLARGLPDLDFVTPRGVRGRDAALAANRDVVAHSTIDDWLPTTTRDGDTAPLLDCTDVAVPDGVTGDDVGLGTVGVVGFTADAPTDVDSLGVAESVNVAYESTDHLYLASSPAAGSGVSPALVDCLDRCVAPGTPTTSGAVDANDSGTTHLVELALDAVGDGVGATHVASGSVEGAVPDRWAMDEHDGVLRLAVAATAETGPFTSVVTMERRGEDLVEAGRLDRLGVHEGLESVRWFDDLAVLVTFRQVDPLYTVDLTDQRAPTLLGRLKVPGFSEYLHPLGSMRLIGVGEGPQPARGGGRGWGGQAGLFDVTDLQHVQRLDATGFGPTSQALAGADPRQFTWLPATRTALTVYSTGYSRAGWVASMHLHDGTFDVTRQRVEWGTDVADVRTVPLPDGRVVLLTGEDARFLRI